MTNNRLYYICFAVCFLAAIHQADAQSDAQHLRFRENSFTNSVGEHQIANLLAIFYTDWPRVDDSTSAALIRIHLPELVSAVKDSLTFHSTGNVGLLATDTTPSNQIWYFVTPSSRFCFWLSQPSLGTTEHYYVEQQIEPMNIYDVELAY